MTKLNLVVIILTGLGLTGCYYVQAARGHMQLMSKRESFETVLDDDSTSAELARRIELVREARDFSIDVLGLPDNDSYRTYADIGRDQVLWNIFAAPEFSLEPETWCYPFVGCLAYRGYFQEDTARRLAQRLRDDGLDVAVGGVTAYSTLGRFDDPVLNTMMAWDDVRLVGLLFHELAHQVLYIRDDTAFNESFATTVEELGLELWLSERGEEEALSTYRERKQLERIIMDLVDSARADLKQIYASGNEAEMRVAKASRLERLASGVREALDEAGLPKRHWLLSDLNNARLVPLALYEGLVPGFRGVYASCEANFDCFFSEARRIGGLAAAERERILVELAETAGP